MKIRIDKKGGLHYHKVDCPISNPTKPPFFPYETIEHNMQGLGVKYIDGRWYYPCPFCYLGKRRKEF